MDITWMMGIFFVFLAFVYIALVIFVPEWVGIQGRTARKIEESHTGQPPEETDRDSKPH